MPNITTFEEGWDLMQKGINKLKNILEGFPEPFTTEEYTLLYTNIYNMCTQTPPYDYSEALYEKYKETFDDYIKSTNWLSISNTKPQLFAYSHGPIIRILLNMEGQVLPSLQEKKDELLLRELLKRWSNHKLMTCWLSKFFRYLDRYYTPKQRLPSLEETGFLSFYHLVGDEIPLKCYTTVYDGIHRQVMDAILAMIDRKCAGEPIDETLVNGALSFYSEIGECTRKNDPKHFAETMMKENVANCNMSRLQIS
ncbi:hypothetical protein TSUD_197600 [Trifolium subterraneum]|uniref:Cullin N-terminal domain-containing protein n=1 Tax=Trifolium subterraneum TaxID=3900 RepID=A0A2Z6MHH1_TRISU|nr:hypothetical protein TSUD_197600 [Trifolium subterraneum]